MFKKGRQKLMRRLFKGLISIAVVGLILMLIIPIIQKKQEETKGVKIEEVKEKKETKREVTKTIEKTERREVKKEKAVKKQKPAEPVKEVPEVSVPKVKVKKEMPKKVKEEISKAVEITEPERKDAEKEKITVTKPSAKTKILENAQDVEEITGLIIEKTMTRIGYEFYEKFFSFWEAPEGIGGYNVYINEKASPMWGSLVHVKVNNTLVWKGVIRPRSEDVEKAVKSSIGAVKNYLYQKEDDYVKKGNE